MNGPDRIVVSGDGTPIAVFATPADRAVGRAGVAADPEASSATSPASARPLVLVHGTGGDHTTFRVIGPRLARHRPVLAIDRRGRGASGDTLPYAYEREAEDVAAVAEALADDTGAPVSVFGHSYGGRVALGAALLTTAIDRVVSYEGAPTPPGTSYHPSGIEARLDALLAAGDADAAYATFMAEVVGMPPVELAAYRREPVWPARVAAAGTIPREFAAETDPAASLEALGSVRRPVLQLLGSASLPAFGEAVSALDARLADGRVVVIDGARHAAHHTHPDAVITSVETFLG